MISLACKKKYYQAFIAKRSNFDGIFFVAVKSTGIFCHATCPARKPKFENCEFYTSAPEAMAAGFRPCKRCSPLSYPHSVSTLIQTLIKTIELQPEKRWKDEDFRELAVDASTVRRQFKKRFGMTFVQYARMRRMDRARSKIQIGETAIDTQLAVGYESSAGFREAFSQLFGEAPTLLKHHHYLKASWFDSPLGPLVAVADDSALYMLQFADHRDIFGEVKWLKQKTKSRIIPGDALPIKSIQHELALYFSGELKEFKTPLFLLGTSFQKKVWNELKEITYGKTKSYAAVAKAINKPTAYRAVAQANGANQLVIVIPCHRVINTDGKLGGYSSGLDRKVWLLKHEKNKDV